MGTFSGVWATAFNAQAKNVLAASLSRVVLNMVSTRFPTAGTVLR